MTNDPDMELVDLAIGGDERSFESLIERHYMSIYQLSFRWCRVKEEAEEITHEVFIKLGRKLNSFNRRSSFKTWLYRITINTAKDYSRKNATSRSYEAAFAEEQAMEKANTSSSNPVDVKEIYNAIDSLPSRQKAALMLVAAEGMNHKEAAAVLNCSETTVSWRIHQARKTLKKIFSGWYEDGK
jgi:RNA polymerase sigma-70 factor (ECF subfamily)